MITWTPFRRLKYLTSAEFFNLRNSNNIMDSFRSDVESGDIYVIKNITSETLIDRMLYDITNKAYPDNSDPRVIEGIKNIKYTSTAEKFSNKETNSSHYNAVDVSYYFFPWNNDDIRVFESLKDIYECLIQINGYKPNQILNHTPKDRSVLRLHLIHYPPGSGEISLHIDPIKYTTVNAGIYFSEYGRNYKDGGFYVVDSNKNEVKIDPKITKGDMALFSPNLAHGVRKITSCTKKSTYDPGRYFFHISIVESHEFKDRQKSMGLNLKDI
jgi:hypothetical protein